MKSFNVVTGMPRSGSTLLCNVLNQNPKFYASSTSPLAGFVGAAGNYFTYAAEFKNMLINNGEESEMRLKASVDAFLYEWYNGKDKEVIFDKSRAWASNALALRDIIPDSLIIVMVRDLRSIFGSVEKQHRRSPILDEAVNLQEKSVFSRADVMFSPQGLIGAPLLGVEDLCARQLPNVLFVSYEIFSSNPELILDRIYSKLEVDMFKHDLNDVKNVAEDVDGMYLNKYPHEGSGKIQPPSNPEEWREYVPEGLANNLMAAFPRYNQMFGYAQEDLR